jgi:hypothetical protein
MNLPRISWEMGWGVGVGGGATPPNPLNTVNQSARLSIQLSKLGPPTPSPARRCCSLPVGVQGGRHRGDTLACGEGMWGPNPDDGTDTCHHTLHACVPFEKSAPILALLYETTFTLDDGTVGTLSCASAHTPYSKAMRVTLPPHTPAGSGNLGRPTKTSSTFCLFSTQDSCSIAAFHMC